MIKEFFKDSIKYLPSGAIPSIMSIITVPVVTHLFPPSDYGDYALVIITISLLSTIASAWLNSSIVRFFPMYEKSNKLVKFYSVLLKLSFISIGVVCFAFLGIFFSIRKYISLKLYSLMQVGILVFIVTSCFSILLTLLRVKRQVTWYTTFLIYQSIVGFSLGILLIVIFHLGIEGLLWGSLISTVTILPLLWRISLGKLSSLDAGNIYSSMGWEIAKYGLPAMGINILSWAQSFFDRYILKLFKNSWEVGIYSASYALAERSVFFIVSLFLLASNPIAFDIWEKQGLKASRKFVAELTRYYLLISFPITVGISILAKPLVNLLVAPEYRHGYKVIPIVASGAFLVGVAHRFTTSLAYYKRTDLSILCYFGSVVVNVILNILFIPKYGYMAAALTTFIAYAFLLLSVIPISLKFFVWKFPFKSLGKIVVASIIMAIAVYPIGNSLTVFPLLNLIVSIPLGIGIYFGVLFLFKEIQPVEKAMLRDIINFFKRIILSRLLKT